MGTEGGTNKKRKKKVRVCVSTRIGKNWKGSRENKKGGGIYVIERKAERMCIKRK